MVAIGSSHPFVPASLVQAGTVRAPRGETRVPMQPQTFFLQWSTICKLCQDRSGTWVVRVGKPRSDLTKGLLNKRDHMQHRLGDQEPENRKAQGPRVKSKGTCLKEEKNL